MSERRYLVTGATGKTGGAVTRQLLAGGHKVRALVHRRDARSAALHGAGAEVVVGELFDPIRIGDALGGISAAYYCPPFTPYMIQSASAFAVAAKEARLEALVSLSQWLSSPESPALLTRQHWLADRILGMLPETMLVTLNPGFFADNYLRVLPLAAQLGVFASPTGTGRNAPPSNEDIARVAVTALLDPARHAGNTYRPTGPALLSGSDMAEIMGRVLERPVRHADISVDMLLKAMCVMGATKYEMDVSRFYFREQQRGSFAHGAPTTDVLDVTGGPAEEFETTVRRYAAAPEIMQTNKNKFAALATFARIGITPAYDLDRYERDLQLPEVATPRTALDSERWLAEHAAREPRGSAQLVHLDASGVVVSASGSER